MLSEKNKAKLKNFLVSSAEYITGNSLICNSYIMSFNCYEEGTKTFPSILMRELLDTEFDYFETNIYQKGTSDIPCDDAVMLYKRKKVDFLDLLIFCAIHHLDRYTINFSYHTMHLYTFDAARGFPTEYCDDKRISVDLGDRLEHDMQELAEIVRGVIWYLIDDRAPCTCHPDPMHRFNGEFETIHCGYWELDAGYFFRGELNLPRIDMRKKHRQGFKDGILPDKKCNQCRYFVNKAKSNGSCDYDYHDVCRMVLMSHDGDSVACKHFEGVL